jgi:hypothetical protein
METPKSQFDKIQRQIIVEFEQKHKVECTCSNNMMQLKFVDGEGNKTEYSLDDIINQMS